MGKSKIEVFEIDVKLHTENIVSDAGNSMIKELEKSSPKNTGAYRDGWEQKYDAKKQQTVVYSPKHYRLTHLLENGHLTRSKHKKKRVPPQPHIRPSFERVVKEFYSDCKNVRIGATSKKI